MFHFRMIDLKKDAKTVCRFRRDAFKVSFGDTANFDEDDYLQWLQELTSRFPDGVVLAEMEGEPVGQLELSIRKFEGREIGYVHLYYLAPGYRGNGQGQELHDYARQFFKSHGMDEFHLRVSPTNAPALAFYHKIGMEAAGPEVDGKVIRMIGRLTLEGRN